MAYGSRSLRVPAEGVAGLSSPWGRLPQCQVQSGRDWRASRLDGARLSTILVAKFLRWHGLAGDEGPRGGLEVVGSKSVGPTMQRSSATGWLCGLLSGAPHKTSLRLNPKASHTSFAARFADRPTSLISVKLLPQCCSRFCSTVSVTRSYRRSSNDRHRECIVGRHPGLGTMLVAAPVSEIETPSVSSDCTTRITQQSDLRSVSPSIGTNSSVSRVSSRGCSGRADKPVGDGCLIGYDEL